MSTREIIQHIKSLPYNKRILVIEKSLKALYESKEDQLEKASKIMLDDYKLDKKLIEFTALDFEKFYEAK